MRKAQRQPWNLPLHDFSCACLLCKRGLKQEDTLLHPVAYDGHLNVFKYLVQQCNIDPNLPNKVLTRAYGVWDLGVCVWVRYECAPAFALGDEWFMLPLKPTRPQPSHVVCVWTHFPLFIVSVSLCACALWFPFHYVHACLFLLYFSVCKRHIHKYQARGYSFTRRCDARPPPHGRLFGDEVQGRSAPALVEGSELAKWDLGPWSACLYPYPHARQRTNWPPDPCYLVQVTLSTWYKPNQRTFTANKQW